MTEPRVSLVMPCFNAAAYVGEALESALSQSRPPDEIVVVDDGSTDDSAAVIRRFGGTIRYLRQKNGGIAAARNLGIAKSSGNILSFLDADDLWPPMSVEIRLRLLLSDRRLDLVYGQIETFRHSGSGVVPPVRTGRLASALLVHRASFDRVGNFDPQFQMGETIDWMSRADAAGCLSGEVDAIVLRRRLHDSNTVLEHAETRGEYLRVLRAAVARRQNRRAG